MLKAGRCANNGLPGPPPPPPPPPGGGFKNGKELRCKIVGEGRQPRVTTIRAY